MWGSIVILVVIVGAMYGFLTRAFQRMRVALGNGPASVDREALDRALEARGPMIGAGIGLLGTIVILWLMVLKPS